MSTGQYHHVPEFADEQELEELVCKEARGQATREESEALHSMVDRWLETLENLEEDVSEQLSFRQAEYEAKEADSQEWQRHRWEEFKRHYLTWKSKAMGFRRSIKERIRYVRFLDRDTTPDTTENEA